MATHQTDLLQKFIDNEKKSKTWTLISVLVFIILTGIIISQSFKLKKQSIALENYSDTLYTSLLKADSLVKDNELNKESLENATKTTETLQRKFDSLLATVSPQPNTDTAAIRKAKYTVYVQYIADYRDISKLVLTSLRRNNYNVPAGELMSRETFPSSVKYFNEADRQEAQRIASIINNTVDKFSRTPIRIIKNNTKVPTGQLEVWLGEIKTVRPNLVEQYRIPVKRT